MRPSARDRTVRRVKEVGPRRWKKESGYHEQARVENTFFRYKSIIGDRLRACHPESQEAEALIACNILNRMFKLGRPKFFAMKEPIRQAGAEIRAAFGFMHQRRGYSLLEAATAVGSTSDQTSSPSFRSISTIAGTSHPSTAVA